HLRFRSGARGPAGRHRSLRAVIDWSHDLLDAEERTTFRRLAIFAGAFDLDGAAAVATDGDVSAASDHVARLTDKSLLVHRRAGAGSRWHMLETIHAYGREQLEASGDLEATRHRHLSWATRTAGASEETLDDDDAWHTEFDAVADDLRAALRAAAET